jgi:uncharacterized protein (TIRG00374 family)
MRSQGGRVLLFAVKLAVSVALVAWIIQGVDFSEIGRVLQRSNVSLLVFAFGLYFLGYFLTAVRWRLLISIHGVRPPLLVLVQSFMVGIFFNNFLPSTIGGDVSRMYDVWRIAKDKSSAVSVVLVDRFLGVTALILWATVALLVSPEIRSQSTVTIPVLVVLALAVALVMLIFGRPRAMVAGLMSAMRRLAARAPSFAGKPIGKILNAFGPYYSHNRVLVKALLISLLLQLNVIIHFWLVAVALEIDLSLFAMCVIIPCILMITMLPISINAIGVREVSFVYFMGLFGVSDENALVFAWIAFTFVIVQGFLGGVVFALRRAPPDLSEKDQSDGKVSTS